MLDANVIRIQENLGWELSRQAERDRALHESWDAKHSKAPSVLNGLSVLPILLFVGSLLHVKHIG
jgi:hypothetical protein